MCKVFVSGKTDQALENSFEWNIQWVAFNTIRSQTIILLADMALDSVESLDTQFCLSKSSDIWSN